MSKQPHALKIETFDNSKGGSTFFKAIGHPLALPKIKAILTKLEGFQSIAVFDPHQFMNGFAEIYDTSKLNISESLVQKFEDIDRRVLGHSTKPLTELIHSKAQVLWVAAFDCERLLNTIRHLIPTSMEVISFDAFRIPEDMLSQPKNYLSPLNFATNFAFFRDQNDLHTRLVTANYWTAYSGGKPIRIWFNLINERGGSIHTWTEDYDKPNQSIIIDSQEIRERFKLNDFLGQLFIHIVGAAGHEVVKYALDVYNDTGDIISCTHDANSWPADLYAGLPAPQEDETVILWVQNSHPCPIPAKAIGLALMGTDEVSWSSLSVAPFATLALDTKTLLPHARWPEQIEIYAGKYFVRPRYEIIKNKQRRIAHANVERTDLKNDPEIAKLKPLFGKSFILPAPILPRDRWRSIALPTPMSTGQMELPLSLLIYDKNGKEILNHPLGLLQRHQKMAYEIEDLIDNNAFDFGHMELIYDFAEGGYADGWLHGLFRYEDKKLGYAAETSFGAHIFNTIITYKQEPQSYTGHPPGLSTRLFLSLGDGKWNTLCHLIYPASTPWHATSSTSLILHDAFAKPIATKEIKIPCSGSLFWVAEEIFDQKERMAAGKNAYILIQDKTCRLFGYHGLIHEKGAFGFDHMFGF